MASSLRYRHGMAPIEVLHGEFHHVHGRADAVRNLTELALPEPDVSKADLVGSGTVKLIFEKHCSLSRLL
jgi:hypothetical protein